jgi:hypothetical protein
MLGAERPSITTNIFKTEHLYFTLYGVLDPEHHAGHILIAVLIKRELALDERCEPTEQKQVVNKLTELLHDSPFVLAAPDAKSSGKPP